MVWPKLCRKSPSNPTFISIFHPGFSPGWILLIRRLHETGMVPAADAPSSVFHSAFLAGQPRAEPIGGAGIRNGAAEPGMEGKLAEACLCPGHPRCCLSAHWLAAEKTGLSPALCFAGGTTPPSPRIRPGLPQPPHCQRRHPLLDRPATPRLGGMDSMGVLLVLTCLIGAIRVFTGMHFLRDVLLGAGLSTLIGAVAYLPLLLFALF